MTCGLCCTGHLFSWVGLENEENKKTKTLKAAFFDEEKGKFRLNQPCPYWEGACTIYDHPEKPERCNRYSCNLLKELFDGKISLAHALSKIQQTRALIARLESRLPASNGTCFRMRLFNHISILECSGDPDGSFRLAAGALLVLYEKVFGLADLFEHPGMAEEDKDGEEPSSV